MEIPFQSELFIPAPYDAVFRYVADVHHFAEWSQTVERVEPINPQDDRSQQFQLIERQGMQTTRQPGQPIYGGREQRWQFQILEHSPHYRFRWTQRSLTDRGVTLNGQFDVSADGAAMTRLLLRVTMQTTRFYDLQQRIRQAGDSTILRAQYRAQWEAGLRNISEVVVERWRRDQRTPEPQDALIEQEHGA